PPSPGPPAKLETALSGYLRIRCDLHGGRRSQEMRIFEVSKSTAPRVSGCGRSWSVRHAPAAQPLRMWDVAAHVPFAALPPASAASLQADRHQFWPASVSRSPSLSPPPTIYRRAR